MRHLKFDVARFHSLGSKSSCSVDSKLLPISGWRRAVVHCFRAVWPHLAYRLLKFNALEARVDASDAKIKKKKKEDNINLRESNCSKIQF